MIQIDADALRATLTEAEAADAIEAALAGGLDPDADPDRTVASVAVGQILLMPSGAAASIPAVQPAASGDEAAVRSGAGDQPAASGDKTAVRSGARDQAVVQGDAGAAGYAGVKIVTVAPANPARGLPRIQGIYVLLDGTTLTPVAILDGAALTAIRTPAVSAVAVRHLARPDARRLVVFGTGPQAWGHVCALRSVRPIEQVTVVGRSGTAEFVARCRAAGLSAEEGRPEAVAEADLVACCTSAREPLFAGRLVPDHAVVVAVGSHEPDVREVDEVLVGRATVVVESRRTALREAGELVLPLRSGAIREGQIAGDLADLITGGIRRAPGRPGLFKSVGMAWEDLVVAAMAYERFRGDDDRA